MNDLKLRRQEEVLRELGLFMLCESKGLRGILRKMWHIQQFPVSKGNYLSSARVPWKQSFTDEAHLFLDDQV